MIGAQQQDGGLREDGVVVVTVECGRDGCTCDVCDDGSTHGNSVGCTYDAGDDGRYTCDVGDDGRCTCDVDDDGSRSCGWTGEKKNKKEKEDDKETTWGSGLLEIMEGSTRLLVPTGSMSDAAPPPRKPAFYNPRATINRDLSVVAYSAFLEGFDGPNILLESMAGLGARGLRVANEATVPVQVVINDINPDAVELARRSAGLNSVGGSVEFSVGEACRFLGMHSSSGGRGAITDIDPFGSPAPFFDCAVRSTMHGGLISCTATDLQVLNGLFDHACRNKYGGVPIRGTAYGNETAIRLVTGSLWSVAARLGVSIRPVFVEVEMHYYRVYARLLVRRSDATRGLGYAAYCDACGDRMLSDDSPVRPCMRHLQDCRACGGPIRAAGPLWTGPLFEEEFVRRMQQVCKSITTDRRTPRQLARAASESGVAAGLYYTLDEVASRTNSSPPALTDAILRLQDAGYEAAPTSFSPTGFRTDAPMSRIRGEIFTHR